MQIKKRSQIQFRTLGIGRIIIGVGILEELFDGVIKCEECFAECGSAKFEQGAVNSTATSIGERVVGRAKRSPIDEWRGACGQTGLCYVVIY